MLHLNLEDNDVISSGHFKARPFRPYRRDCMMFRGWSVWTGSAGSLNIENLTPHSSDLSHLHSHFTYTSTIKLDTVR